MPEVRESMLRGSKVSEVEEVKMSTITHPIILRPMDVLHCGDSPKAPPQNRIFSTFTRIFTAGLKSYRDPAVAIHTAIVFPLRDQLMVVEMIGLNEGLRLSSLEVTHENGPRNVLGVSRYAIYDDCKKRDLACDRIAYDLRKTVEYDPKGCLEFAFKRIQDDPKRRICSEYFYIHAKVDGQNFPVRFNARVSPYDLQHFITPGVMAITGY